MEKLSDDSCTAPEQSAVVVAMRVTAFIAVEKVTEKGEEVATFIAPSAGVVNKTVVGIGAGPVVQPLVWTIGTGV